MRTNVLLLGVLIFIMGAVMYVAVTPTATSVFTSAFGNTGTVARVLSDGSSLATGVTASVDSIFKVSFGPSGASLFIIILGALLAVLSQEDVIEKALRRGPQKPKQKRPLMETLAIIPSIVISWLILTLVYFLGFAQFWYTMVTIIVAFVITSYLINIASKREKKHVAFMVFFLFIFVAAFLGNVITAISLSFAQQNVYNLLYAAIASLMSVLLVYLYFHTQHFKEHHHENAIV